MIGALLFSSVFAAAAGPSPSPATATTPAAAAVLQLEERTTFEGRFTHVWARRGKDWQLVPIQRTDIAP